MPPSPPASPSLPAQLWRGCQPGVTVGTVHAHVLALHTRFLEGLDAAGHPTINSGTLLPPQARRCMYWHWQRRC